MITISLSGFVLGSFVSGEWLGLLGLIPIALGLKQFTYLFKRKNNEGETPEIRSGNQILGIALVTIANGGDNIGVYTPLFASLSFQLMLLYLLVFTIMTSILCLLAWYVVSHRIIQIRITKYGHILLPAFLISLGLWIFIEAESYKLLIPSP